MQLLRNMVTKVFFKNIQKVKLKFCDLLQLPDSAHCKQNTEGRSVKQMHSVYEVMKKVQNEGPLSC